MQTDIVRERRHDLDWVRTGAFALLILYHVGMFYVTWDWHVKSPRASHALEPLMYLTSPWRLTLLFFVSGAATRFIAESRTPAAMAGSRIARLLPPLLFGMLVIVPPQTWYEIYEQLGRAEPLAEFYVRYVTASGGWMRDGEPLITPTWNHLWFVVYLLAYSLLLSAGLALFPGVRPGFEAALGRLLSGVGLFVWPVALFALFRLVLLPRFEPTHAFVNDWYVHAVSFSAFLLGFLTVRAQSFQSEVVRLRWAAACIWFFGYLAYAAYAWAWRQDGASPPETLTSAMRVVYALQQWAAIVAVLGFARKHLLNRGGSALRWLTGGIFCFYLVHQTVIVVAGHHLARSGLPLHVEASLLVAATLIGSVLAYEAARRTPLLRRVLGVAPSRAPS